MTAARPLCARLHWLLLLGLAGVFALKAQGIDSNEVRVRSGAYAPRPQFTLRVDTSLVEAGVVVRDQRGRTVGGLTKDDFVITDEGKKRPITAFSVETSTPAAPAPAAPAPAKKAAEPAPTKAAPSRRYVGLLFDDFSMGPGELPQAQTAARRFVKDGLTPGDQAAVFTSSGSHKLSFTADTAALLAAIDSIHVVSQTPVGGMCPHLTPYDSYVIANRIDLDALNAKVAELARCQNKPTPGDATSWEGGGGRGGRGQAPPNAQMMEQVKMQANAVWAEVKRTSQQTLGTLADVLTYVGKMRGSKMILLASSGFLSGTMERELDAIITQALHTSVVINALDAKGLYAGEPIAAMRGGDARAVTRWQSTMFRATQGATDSVASLAYNTGGLFFHNNNDLDLGFHELGVRPEVSYLLGFQPEGARNGKFHKLKVQLTDPKNYSVQARQGYMSVDEAPAAAQPQRRIDTEILGTAVLQEAPATISALADKTADGQPAVNAVFHLDVGRLRFDTLAGVRQQKIAFVAALLDGAGNFVTGKEGAIEFSLNPGTYQQLAANGINATLLLAAPAGRYRLRAVLQEGLDGKVTAFSGEVEIR